MVRGNPGWPRESARHREAALGRTTGRKSDRIRDPILRDRFAIQRLKSISDQANEIQVWAEEVKTESDADNAETAISEIRILLDIAEKQMVEMEKVGMVTDAVRDDWEKTVAATDRAEISARNLPVDTIVGYPPARPVRRIKQFYSDMVVVRQAARKMERQVLGNVTFLLQ